MKIFVTGSSDGLGLLAGQQLVEQGHSVTLHARNAARAEDARRALPAAQDVVTGDLASIAETREVASAANALGPYDAVIHNAGVGYREGRRETVDGLEHVFAINVLAVYLLTALIAQPKRLIYLSSGMHRGGDPNLTDAQWTARRWNGSQAYSDSKLYDAVLAYAVARKWAGVCSNAVEPGWVPTKMGGASAPDDLQQGAETQVWLATSDQAASITGQYFYHKQPREVHPAVRSTEFGDALLAYCARLSGTELSAAR
ncbi:MAG: SDR family NAD(P)-dependent oxidoreductase [Vulcanimicrobiaceae bacterium]|jgi:NAD(P)-dependent dehydrogenase (short-subunit alcohol dehydrogenase family)